MAQIDKEMLAELVVESRDHLASIEPDLLLLEENPAHFNDDLINRIFRAIHSIKGGFGFFGITRLTELAHVMETVLSSLRDKKIVLDSLLSKTI